MWEAIELISQFIPDVFQPAVEEMALWALPHLGDYAEEIRAGSVVTGIPLGTSSVARIFRKSIERFNVGKATLLNIIYEVQAGCTSIVAQDSNGKIWHGRNLDFTLTD